MLYSWRSNKPPWQIPSKWMEFSPRGWNIDVRACLFMWCACVRACAVKCRRQGRNWRACMKDHLQEKLQLLKRSSQEKKVTNSSALIKKEYGKNTSSPQLYIITASSLVKVSSILSAKKPEIVSFQGKTSEKENPFCNSCLLFPYNWNRALK